jgi:hypothetical protein
MLLDLKATVTWLCSFNWTFWLVCKTAGSSKPAHTFEEHGTWYYYINT